MSKEIYISSTPHETRLAIVENDALTEIYYERENEYTLAGSIYNGRVTRVLPGMQSSFVDIGLERDAFLYITDFMEEAPDSAEFDTAGPSESAPRALRSNSTASPEENAVAPRLESGPRTDSGNRSSERGDRGGRGRRGGRDRDRNQDRSAEKPATPEFAAPPQQSFERPRTVEAPRPAVSMESSVDAPDTADAGDAGEGAPGADGSRRWRGRRGRRRGRGTPGQRDEAGQQASSSTSSTEDMESTFEIDGAAEVAAPAVVEEAYVAPVQEPVREEPRREGRRDGQRRDEGRRDQRPPRAPRGFEPKREHYGVDASASSATGPVANAYPDLSAEPDASAEPMILPGESLSKYRKGGEEPATKSVEPPTITLVAATEYAIPAGWDGGATLPGETLSRRRQPESQSSGRSEPRQESRGDSRRDGRREGRPDRNRGGEPRAEMRQDNRAGFRNAAPVVPAPYAQIIQEFDGPSVTETPEEQPEVARTAHPEQFAPSEILHETPSTIAEPVTEAAILPEIVSVEEPETIVPEAEVPVSTEPAEYEPSQASVSYRVDPVPPSEYRQSAPVLEQPALETPIEIAEVAPEPAYELSEEPEEFFEEESAVPAPEVHAQASQPAEHAAHSLAHTITPAPEETVAPIHQEAIHTEAIHTAPIVVAPDVTHIDATGDMLSEPLTLDAAAEPGEVPHPASPIHHEQVVVSIEPEAEQEFSAGFAPGAGSLEEETLDDEDFDATTIHASSIEEMDDLDEETLEGTADLATMIREMSIDQITRSPGSEDDEDDLDEEDLLEDEQGEEQFGMADAEEFEDSDSEESQEEAARTGSPEDAEFFEAQFGKADTSSETGETRTQGTASQDSERRNRREGGRRDGRRGRSDRDNRSNDRGNDRSSSSSDRGGTGDRARSMGGSGDRDRSRGGSGGGRSRQSMQSTNLPAISDLLKPGQEILCQIAKEPIAKKGARITSHIALPGRFLVFMPTVNHTGVSRKIESDGERRRLKEILLSEKGEAAGGFIVRTAAAGASEEELRSDLRFLLNLWADIKARSESSKSPALIYHDLNLIERILRDQVTDNFSAIWVDTETEYERVLRFLQRFQPSLIRRVKLYSKETPLFEQFGITEEINKALRSKVWLKSGGSIVINQTEALVAIDINTGKFVGKTARLEDTIVKTNLDAIPEIVRQIRLRDLGGIIIIDFIDMDERKNRNKVMAALEEELKADRAPSKVLQFNDFGLVAITRKRVKQSLERTLSTTCNVCVGTGMVKSPVTVCNDIYVEMRKMHKHLDRGDVMLRVHPEVVKQLKLSGAKWLQEMEEMCGKTILVKSDPSLHPEQFDVH